MVIYTLKIEKEKEKNPYFITLWDFTWKAPWKGTLKWTNDAAKVSYSVTTQSNGRLGRRLGEESDEREET